MQDFQFKDKYDAYDLVKIMQLLRAPGGCPWDAEQTHQSIKKNLIEETYEVIEAINKDDKALMCEELGGSAHAGRVPRSYGAGERRV